MKYQTVIGLEVHVELNTASKMFCSCSADYFGKEPNSLTCPVCLGLPGALPYINQEAIDKCMQIGLALGCQVSSKSRFERKNYFYPDLAKGFQTSQLRWPLCINGSIDVEGEKGQKTTIQINRVHQEEDTAKLTHKGNMTVVDFNRSGVPLVEIVTEPDFRDSETVRNYAKALQQIFRDLNVSNADMERGDMRLEANISVRPEGQEELANYRVELKNINSFRFMKAAIEYEIKRQIEALERGENLSQETRGWNEEKGETYLQRRKEEANDYRYFPEPDLPEMEIDSEQVAEIKANLPKLQHSKMEEYLVRGILSPSSSASLVAEPRKLQLFEELYESEDNLLTPIALSNLIANYPVSKLNDLTRDSLVEMIKAQAVNVIDDTDELNKWVNEVIEANPTGAVDSYRGGKKEALGVLVGMVMRKSGGKVDAGKVREILIEVLG